MIENGPQFSGRQAIVQWQQDGTQPRQCEQQHQHGRVIQPHVGHAVAQLHPMHPQHVSGPLNTLPQLVVADIFALKMKGAPVRRRPGVPLDDVG